MFRALAFVIISTALAATAAAAPATFERRAHDLVDRHFAALAAGDANALAAIWSPTATVTSPTAGGSVRVVPIATAIPIWLGARDGVHGWIRRTQRRGDRIEIDAVVRWNGRFYRDRLVVAYEHGDLKIASKWTAPIAREAPRRTGYGG